MGGYGLRCNLRQKKKHVTYGLREVFGGFWRFRKLTVTGKSRNLRVTDCLQSVTARALSRVGRDGEIGRDLDWRDPLARPKKGARYLGWRNGHFPLPTTSFPLYWVRGWSGLEGVQYRKRGDPSILEGGVEAGGSNAGGHLNI